MECFEAMKRALVAVSELALWVLLIVMLFG